MDELIENQNFVDSSNIFEKTKEERKYLNVSYSDISLDGGGLSSPPLGMMKVQRRR